MTTTGIPLRVRASLGGDGAYHFGYLEAADTLLKSAQGYPPFWHLYPFPVASLYRHALELALKMLIPDAREAIAVTLRLGNFDEQQRVRAERFLESNPPQTHDLVGLLGHAVGALHVLGADTLPPQVDATVQLLHGIDPTNEAFRYSRRRRDGAPTPAAGDGLELDELGTAVHESCRHLAHAQNEACIIAQQLPEFADDCYVDDYSGDY